MEADRREGARQGKGGEWEEDWIECGLSGQRRHLWKRRRRRRAWRWEPRPRGFGEVWRTASGGARGQAAGRLLREREWIKQRAWEARGTVINAFLRVHKLTECYGPPSILLRLRLTEALIQPDLAEAWSPAQPKPKDVRENSLA